MECDKDREDMKRNAILAYVSPIPAKVVRKVPLSPEDKIEAAQKKEESAKKTKPKKHNREYSFKHKFKTLFHFIVE